jgi:hypothetical protein
MRKLTLALIFVCLSIVAIQAKDDDKKDNKVECPVLGNFL